MHAYSDDDGSFTKAVHRCVGVGLCRSDEEAMCPSYQISHDEVGSTRGRARSLAEMLRGETITDGWRSKETLNALDLCLSCKACAAECPVNVDMATYKSEFLHHHYGSGPRSFLGVNRRPMAHLSMGWLPLLLRVLQKVPGSFRLINRLEWFRPVEQLTKRLGGIDPRRRMITFFTGGVDTHKDTHHAAILDQQGRLLATQGFPATAKGYRQLLAWMRSFGNLASIGVEGTGSYGAGLSTFLHSYGVSVRPNQDALADPLHAVKAAMHSLACRIRDLSAEIAALTKQLGTLVTRAAPRTTGLLGISTEHAGQLLVTAGNDPERMHSESAFTALCAACPIPASSGKTNRHRLNPGGDHAANSTLHMIAVVRMRWCPATRNCVTRRLSEGMAKREIIRCLKRYIARQIFRALRDDLKDLANNT